VGVLGVIVLEEVHEAGVEDLHALAELLAGLAGHLGHHVVEARHSFLDGVAHAHLHVGDGGEEVDSGDGGGQLVPLLGHVGQGQLPLDDCGQKQDCLIYWADNNVYFFTTKEKTQQLLR
jgi:hypothetical protein